MSDAGLSRVGMIAGSSIAGIGIGLHCLAGLILMALGMWLAIRCQLWNQKLFESVR